MKNKFKLLIGTLVVAGILTVGISGAVLADSGDEDGSYGPGYCQYNCLGTGNGGSATSGGWSCH